mmetsp:Transcript_38551/g.79092  ORF Transcript_38551/g.79092 Transcript_38551/m.79092 type:complete len:192 (+) Transcript_38551:217-792(+)
MDTQKINLRNVRTNDIGSGGHLQFCCETLSRQSRNTFTTKRSDTLAAQETPEWTEICIKSRWLTTAFLYFVYDLHGWLVSGAREASWLESRVESQLPIRIRAGKCGTTAGSTMNPRWKCVGTSSTEQYRCSCNRFFSRNEDSTTFAEAGGIRDLEYGAPAGLYCNLCVYFFDHDQGGIGRDTDAVCCMPLT